MAYRQGMDIRFVHVAVNGEGRDVPFNEIDVEQHPTVDQIKGAMEQHLGLAAGALRTYQIDGYETTGQVVLRPDAKLGAETDVRLRIMNSLLTCPHRDIDSIVAYHKEMMNADPEFYAHFAVWSQGHTQVRDHKEAFIACLFASPYTEFREVAYVLLQDLPPYQVERISRQVQGGWVSLNIRPPKAEGEKVAKGTPKPKGRKGPKAPVDPRYKSFQDLKKEIVAAREANKDANLDPFKVRVRELFKLAKDADIRFSFSRSVTKLKDKEGKKTGETKRVTKVHFDYYRPGLLPGAPRIMQTGIKNFLKSLERDEKRFDLATVRQYHALKTLYSTYHVSPSETADLILFKDRPPEGSMRAAVKHIAHIEDPVEWAKAVVAAGIPYPVAVGLLPTEMTPVHLIGLINNMSPQELLNSVASLEARGAMDNADVKALIEQKLGKAGNSKRVDALKAQKAAAVVGSKVSEETRKKIEAVSDKQVRRLAKIKKPTALAIDASTSMTEAIDLGKEIGALISPCAHSTFVCATFNDMARIYDVKSDKKSDWDTALRFVKAVGCTDIGSVVPAVKNHIDKLRKDKPDTQLIEQFVLVTDEGENRTPSFATRLEEYRKATGVSPNVVIVRIGKEAVDKVEKELRAKDFEVDVWTPDVNGGKVDYYSIPNLLPLLSKGSKAELLTEIMEVPLPKRSEWDEKHLPKPPASVEPTASI
jgi:hypothetical protein